MIALQLLGAKADDELEVSVISPSKAAKCRTAA